jgi:hypothetical protein
MMTDIRNRLAIVAFATCVAIGAHAEPSHTLTNGCVSITVYTKDFKQAVALGLYEWMDMQCAMV